ncbi:MAG: hypothetical protein NTU74_00565 [Deltaproteobacteria bacterium]|nr:hypothetical protein [Deltaproteobacteria bacterium]
MVMIVRAMVVFMLMVARGIIMRMGMPMFMVVLIYVMFMCVFMGMRVLMRVQMFMVFAFCHGILPFDQ